MIIQYYNEHINKNIFSFINAPINISLENIVIYYERENNKEFTLNSKQNIGEE